MAETDEARKHRIRVSVATLAELMETGVVSSLGVVCVTTSGDSHSAWSINGDLRECHQLIGALAELSSRFVDIAKNAGKRADIDVELERPLLS